MIPVALLCGCMWALQFTVFSMPVLSDESDLTFFDLWSASTGCLYRRETRDLSAAGRVSIPLLFSHVRAPVFQTAPVTWLR